MILLSKFGKLEFEGNIGLHYYYVYSILCKCKYSSKERNIQIYLYPYFKVSVNVWSYITLNIADILIIFSDLSSTFNMSYSSALVY